MAWKVSMRLTYTSNSGKASVPWRASDLQLGAQFVYMLGYNQPHQFQRPVHTLLTLQIVLCLQKWCVSNRKKMKSILFYNNTGNNVFFVFDSEV